ncbi:MAG: alpha/beta hydrolase [Dokdonella sp.]
MMRRSVVCILLACWVLSAGARERTTPVPSRIHAITEIGTQAGAAYRIDIPADWNQGLVIFFHGYSTEPIVFGDGERLSPMFDPMLARGFAVIQSGYSAAGWAVEQAGDDSERLRRFFIGKHGQPKETFAMGMSMGGILSVMAVETSPQTYDGALSLCGAIEPSDRLMQRDFAVVAAFDFYFPGIFGTLVPFDEAYKPTDEIVLKIATAMRANPKAAASLRALYGAGDEHNLPGVLASIAYDIKEMQQRTHGNPFGNADLIYTGSTDDYALNDGVKRFRADPRALALMSRWYTPSGNLLKPLLALHDTGDPLVIASTAFEYAMMAQWAGHGDHFVQQYLNAQGHCAFTIAQIGKAFDQLVEWSRTGKRPPSGRQH